MSKYNHRSRWRYKAAAIYYVSPQLRLKCAQGQDYIDICRYRSVRPQSLPAESRSLIGMARGAAAMPPAVIRNFISIQMLHTDTPCRSRAGEMKMTMTWQWQWDDKLPIRDTRWGKQKRKEKKEKTPTPTHLAQNGQTLKGQGKRKSGRTTGQTPTRGGGADGSAWHNLQGESQTYPARGTQTWPTTREHAWNKGPMGD